MGLTRKQHEQLKAEPVGQTGNRLARAIELGTVIQVEMAKELGFSQQYVSDVARGRHKTITVENAHKFAAYFGCELGDLFPAREAIAS